MKKIKFLFPLVALALSGCSLFSSNTTNDPITETGTTEHAGNSYDYTSQIIVSEPGDISVEEITGEFV